MLEAIARDTLGDPAAADAALERALDLSERSGDLTPFLLYPAAGLLECHARHRTVHAALVAEIRGVLAGTQAESQCGAPSGSRPERLLEPLSGSEARVLRYLPTNLTGPEIAGQPLAQRSLVAGCQRASMPSDTREMIVAVGPGRTDSVAGRVPKGRQSKKSS